MEVRTLSYTRAGGWSDDLPDWDSPNTLVLAFGASCYLDNHDPLVELAAGFPNSAVLGCSTSGEIHGVRIADESLSVAVARFDQTSIRLATSEITAATSRRAGSSIALDLTADDLAGVIVLSSGLDVNGSDLAAGINERLGGTVPVTGGLAGDGDRFERTWVLIDGKPAEHGVAAIGFYGDSIVFHHGSQGGWDIFGPERQVTRSRGNVLFELDGRPALALYKQYLGELADGLPATGLLFPLEVTDPATETKLVRTILAVDENHQSVTFAGDIPVGHRAQLMRANFERVIGGAEDAARTAASNGAAGETLCVAVSCVGRRLVLGGRTEEELEAVLDVLPAGTHQVGFYSYGEISPYTSGSCDLHNQTMTLTTLAETKRS